jgi:hypothetical protein
VIRTATGTRVFGRDALTGALAERGLAAIHQRMAGLGSSSPPGASELMNGSSVTGSSRRGISVTVIDCIVLFK